ncbi:MAG: RidA family protein [Candidatus Margulisiibacteriota bacterium]
MLLIEASIKSLGYLLPPSPVPAGAYIPAVKTGNLIFTAGMIPTQSGEVKFAGKIGAELTLEQGGKAAVMCLLNALAAIKGIVGDLDKIERAVKLCGYVNSAPGFTEQHKVMNYASELLQKIFGEKGKHARIAVGMTELPLNAAVELDLIVEIKAA